MPKKIAEKIKNQIQQKTEEKCYVIIADTDKTYKFRSFFFTPRPNLSKALFNLGEFHFHYRSSP